MGVLRSPGGEAVLLGGGGCAFVITLKRLLLSVNSLMSDRTAVFICLVFTLITSKGILPNVNSLMSVKNTSLFALYSHVVNECTPILRFIFANIFNFTTAFLFFRLFEY